MYKHLPRTLTLIDFYERLTTKTKGKDWDVWFHGPRQEIKNFESKDYKEKAQQASKSKSKKTSVEKSAINLVNTKATPGVNQQQIPSKSPAGEKVERPWPTCFVCSAERHKIKNCQAFASMTSNKRAEFMSNGNRCMTCLFETNHLSKDCRRKTFIKCNASGCKKPESHPTLLHGSTFDIKKYIEDKKKDDGYVTASSSVESTTEVNRALNSSSNGSTLFKLVPVRVTSGSTSIDTYAFIDSDSK